MKVFGLFLVISFCIYSVIKIYKWGNKRNHSFGGKKSQGSWKSRAEKLILSGSKHPYVKSVISELELRKKKQNGWMVDVFLCDRIRMAECLLNDEVYEYDNPIKEEFSVLFAHNSSWVKKVYSDSLDELEDLLDSNAQDYYYDLVEDQYGDRDNADEIAEKKIEAWSKKSLTAKLNFYIKTISEEMDGLEDVLAEFSCDFSAEDFTKYVKGLKVKKVTSS